jgi:hypothetical protein
VRTESCCFGASEKRAWGWWTAGRVGTCNGQRKLLQVLLQVAYFFVRCDSLSSRQWAGTPRVFLPFRTRAPLPLLLLPICPHSPRAHRHPQAIYISTNRQVHDHSLTFRRHLSIYHSGAHSPALPSAFDFTVLVRKNTGICSSSAGPCSCRCCGG